MKKLLLVIIASVICITGFTQAVGIGTNSPHPSAQLDVTSTTKGLLVPRMTLAQRGAINSPAPGLLIYQTDNNPGYYSYNGSFWAFTSNYWTTLTGSEIFYANGTVAVGGFFNQAAFNVVGDQIIYGAAPMLIFRPQTGATTSQMRFQLPDATNEFAITNFNNRLYFSRMSANSVASDLVLTNTGNLGIGTTNPNAKLHVATTVLIGGGDMVSGYALSVNGKIISEEVRVELFTPWPDYVFDKSYQLTPISELEKFISTHKHLPNIPAAAQVEKEGFELGDMNKKLLEKIEELTLYIIQQDKKITALQQRVEKITTER